MSDGPEARQVENEDVGECVTFLELTGLAPPPRSSASTIDSRLAVYLATSFSVNEVVPPIDERVPTPVMRIMLLA